MHFSVLPMSDCRAPVGPPGERGAARPSRPRAISSTRVVCLATMFLIKKARKAQRAHRARLERHSAPGAPGKPTKGSMRERAEEREGNGATSDEYKLKPRQRC